METFLKNIKPRIPLLIFLFWSVVFFLPEISESGFLFGKNLVFTPNLQPADFNFINIFEHIVYFLSKIIPSILLQRFLLIGALTLLQSSMYWFLRRLNLNKISALIVSTLSILNPFIVFAVANFSIYSLYALALVPIYLNLTLELFNDEYKEDELYKIFMALSILFILDPFVFVVGLIILTIVLFIFAGIKRHNIEAKQVSYTGFIIFSGLAVFLIGKSQGFIEMIEPTQTTVLESITWNYLASENIQIGNVIVIVLIALLSLALVVKYLLNKSLHRKANLLYLIGCIAGTQIISILISAEGSFLILNTIYTMFFGFISLITLAAFTIDKLADKYQKVFSNPFIVFGAYILTIIVLTFPFVFDGKHKLEVSPYPQSYEVINYHITPGEKILILPWEKYIQPEWLNISISDPSKTYFGANSISNNSVGEVRNCDIEFSTDALYGDSSIYDVCFNYEDNADIFRSTLTNLKVKYILVNGKTLDFPIVESDSFKTLFSDSSLTLLEVY